MSGARPALSADLPAETFEDWYWLRSELTAFCRAEGLRATGSKGELAARVSAYLRTGTRCDRSAPRPRRARMPERFDEATVVGEGWRCSQPLRAFFEARLGPGFRFDAAMRALIASGAGLTLAQVMERHAAQRAAPGRSEIAPQFEYNRFMRAFSQERPGASHADAVAAWRRHRSAPRSSRDREA